MTAPQPAAGRGAMLSVVIPTLNAAQSLGRCLDAVAEAGGAELIVVDGGSTDQTVAIARDRRVGVHLTRRGRGPQLRSGGRLAGRPWLLFLHADTRLPASWLDEVENFTIQPDAPRLAATFRFGLDDPGWRARLLERLVAIRVRCLGLAYGDQGLLIHRTLYERLGGYKDLPLMEDVDLIRRVGRERLVVLPATATTSAVRWRTDGWLRRSARNLTCLALFHLGVSPRRIAQLYGR